MQESLETCEEELLAGSVTSSKIKRFVTVNLFDIRHKDTEFGVCPDRFGLALVQYFHTMFPFLNSGKVTSILYHYMMEICNLLFNFDFLHGYEIA